MAVAAPVAEQTKRAASAPALAYAGVIFLGAFLLFLVQPIVARAILPWFGGSAAVWTTCMLFFQAALLAGYLYAYCLVRYLGDKAQRAVHVALLAASLLLLPIVPHERWKPDAAADPALRILALLAAVIGLPYLLLSATSPLFQAWYARTREAAAPYRLFALSNAASLLALVGYPALVEPLLPARAQAHAWSWIYGAFAVLSGVTAIRGGRFTGAAGAGPVLAEAGGGSPGWDLYLLWLALAACPSALLLAVTNHLTKNVAPVPFLWILPLGLYLLSFILCFEGRGWYKRGWFLKLLLAAFAAVCYGLSLYGETAGFRTVISIFAAALFVCCMVCHGELARLRPDPRRLTSFYLMCSLGGALGGVFVALVAPYLFNISCELALGLAACVLLPVVVLYRESQPSSRGQARWAVAAMAAGLAVYVAIYVRDAAGGARLSVRNFYGILRVLDSGRPDQLDAVRSLSHGTINHGEQFLHPDRRRWPTAYYSPQSGVALALDPASPHPRRVGVIGLGAGVLAAYGRPGDYYRFYEINPLVVRLARSEFSFLGDCPAQVDVVVADGRLALEREPPQHFDVLVLDAFSGDSIPVHLLTKEAFALYFRHLKPEGVLAVNISNTYLDLVPVVGLAVKALSKEARLVGTGADLKNRVFAAVWILASGRSAFFETLDPRRAAPVAIRPKVRMWTDDYSNLLQVLK